MAVDLDALVAAIVDDLRSAGDPERAVQEKRYLKSDLDFYGATVPAVARAARKARRGHPDLSRTNLLKAVKKLWAARVFEHRMAAVDLLELYLDRLQPADLGLVERFIRESHTWALVDNLAAPIAGPLVEHHPGLGRELDRWSVDPDFWIRRSALLALLGPLRRGEGDFDRFAGYADAMLDEKEFFIRKAIGWVLREAGRRRPDLVDGWLAPRTHRASGVTVREAVKYLPPDRRDALLAAYREKRPAGDRSPGSVWDNPAP